MAETSDRVSSMAARHRKITGADIRAIVERGKEDELATDIRTYTASLHRQDEHRGFRGIIRKLNPFG